MKNNEAVFPKRRGDFGDTIQTGEFIGKLKKAEGADEYELVFVILVGRKEIRDERYIAFFKRFK